MAAKTASQEKKASKRDDAPSTDPYVPPKKGFMSRIPSPLLPYAQLVRLDEPGLIYMSIPILFGAFMAGAMSHVPLGSLGKVVLLIWASCVPLTFINYSWNDLVDANFDRQVARTRHRPIARGAISKHAAVVFNLGVAGILVAVTAALPPAFKFYAAPIGLAIFIYPISKRFTNFPQIIFGPTYASGIFLGAAAFKVTPFVTCTSSTKHLSWETLSSCYTSQLAAKELPVVTLFASIAIWAFFYEIIYSFQDVRDDAKAGVGSIALLIGRRPKLFLAVPAVAQPLLLALAGIQADFGTTYFAMSVGATALAIVVELYSVDLKDPKSCIWWFSRGAMITAMTILSGLLLEYF